MIHDQSQKLFFLAIGFAIAPTVNADILVSQWQTNNVVLVSENTGQVIREFVTPGSGGLSTPNGLAWGPDGNLYVASADTSQVLRFSGQTGAFIDVFAQSPINRTSFIDFGPDGNLNVCSTNDDRVLRFDGVTGDFVDVFIEGGALDWPAGLSWSDGVLYVSRFATRGILQYNAETGDPLGLLTSTPRQPLYTVPIGSEILVAEYAGGRIGRYDKFTGVLLGTLDAPNLNGPVGLELMPDGTIVGTSWNNGRIFVWDANTGDLIHEWSGYTLPNDVIAFIPAPASGGVLILGAALAKRPRRR